MSEWEEKLRELCTVYGPEKIQAAAGELFGTKNYEIPVVFHVEGAAAMKADLAAVRDLAQTAGDALRSMAQEVEIKISRVIPLDWFPVVNPMAVQDTLNRLDERRAKLAEAQAGKEQGYKGYRKAEADVELARAEAVMNIPAEYNKNDQQRKAWEKRSAAREIEILAAKQDEKDCADSDYGFAMDDLRAVGGKAELQAAVLKYLAGGSK